MNLSRRRLLQTGVASLAGGAGLVATGSGAVMAAEAETNGEVSVRNDDGVVSNLLVDGLDIEFSWKGINDLSEDVSFALGLRLAGPDGPSTPGEFGEIVSGAITLDAASGGGTVGEDVQWATPPWDAEGTIDLLTSDSPISADDLAVTEPQSTNEYDLEFQLSFDHKEGDAVAESVVPLVVENTSSKVIDDFESGNLDAYSGEVGGFSLVGDRPFEGASALYSSVGSSRTMSSMPEDGLQNYPSRGDLFSFRCYPTTTGADMRLDWAYDGETGDCYRIWWWGRGWSAHSNDLDLQGP